MRTIYNVAAIAVAVGFVALLVGWTPLLAWWRYGDVSTEDRIALFERRLTGTFGGVAARLPDGTIAIVRRADVTGTGETMCRRESECQQRWCNFLHVRFHCAYRIRMREGGDAVAYLLLTATTNTFDVLALGSPQEFSAELPNLGGAAKELCTLGFGCPGAGRPLQPSKSP